MSDKTDTEPVGTDIENSTNNTPTEAVSNGLEGEKQETETTNPAQSPESKETSESSPNMTNKDKPSQRPRLRSRSKSSNFEELKQEKAIHESEDKEAAPIEISDSKTTKEEVAESSKSSSDLLDSSEASPIKEENEKPEEVRTQEDEEQESATENDPEEDVGEAGPSGSMPSTPMVVDNDEGSSDFPGFDNVENKYLAFSVVLRPYEENIPSSSNRIMVAKSKGNSENGHLNPTVKLTPLSPRFYRTVRNSPSHKVDISNPLFRKPLECGWRRELVFRTTNDSSRKNSDIYYYTPNNKKVRSLREVQEHLIPDQDLTTENFTFCKEPLGVDDPEKEIIRDAKYKPNRASQDDFYTLPLKKAATPKGKSIVKKAKARGKKAPVVVKEIQELPPMIPPGSSSLVTPRIVMKTCNSNMKPNSKKTNFKIEKKRRAAGPDDLSPLNPVDEEWDEGPKAQVREVCSIECRLAMGLIPTLQCVKCLCLFHPECVNLPEAKNRQILSYVCKYCQNSAKTPTKLPPPPPLTPIVSPVPFLKKDKEVKVVATTCSTSPVGGRSQSIVGAVTTWLPPTSSIQLGKGPPPIAPRPELESSPQSLISLQGKKFVVIPKQNIVKFDGGSGGGVSVDETPVVPPSPGQTPNPTGVYLVPYTLPSTSGTYVVQAPSAASTYIVTSSNTPSTLTNGLKRGGSDTGSASDSGSPPAKMVAVSPKSVPSVKAIGVPKPAPKVSPSPKQGGAKAPALPPVSYKSAISGSTQPSLALSNFMMNINAGYIALLHAFQFLKVHELLRAACVSRMWRHIASHRTLWETVKMKNSLVRDWEGFGRSLRYNGTRCLDLKKMLVPEGNEAVAEMWKSMVAALRTVGSLNKIDVGRCSPENLEMIAKACPQLESFVALAIKGQSIDLGMFKGENLVELKLKSIGGIDIHNFAPLKDLPNLKHLALTTVKKLVGLENMLPESLESLELGDCCQMSDTFATETLPRMRNLTRLRLEKGQTTSCPTSQLLVAISGLEKLTQLELINFDIKPGFDKSLSKCVNIRTLLIIPTYVTQSATTNHVVMGGVTKLSATLTYFIWGLTLELLRVTDLFIDQVEGQKQKTQAKKGAGDSIPILKPLKDETTEPNREGQTTSQVDILALPKLQKVLSTLLPTTKIKILKVPFSATWRQTVD